jgi:hypothetical protein
MSSHRLLALSGLLGLSLMAAAPALAAPLPAAPAVPASEVAEEAQYRPGDRIIRRGRYGRQVCTIRYERVVTRSGRIITRPVEVCRWRPRRFR